MRLIEFLHEITGFKHDNVNDMGARMLLRKQLQVPGALAKLKPWFEHGAYTIMASSWCSCQAEAMV